MYFIFFNIASEKPFSGSATFDEEVIEDAEMADEIKTADEANLGSGATPTTKQSAGNSDPGPSGSIPGPEWCMCGHCRPMPRDQK